MGLRSIAGMSVKDLGLSRWRRPFAVVLGGMSLALLAACSAPRTVFDLTTVSENFTARLGRPGQLAVAEPTAIFPVESDRIAVRAADDSVSYLAGAQWSNNLPRLIQTRLIQSFENAHLLRSVGRPGIAADYTLKTDLRRFELDVARSQTVVEIAAQLVKADGRILAGRIFSANMPVAADEGATVAKALDLALSMAMRQIITWTAPQI